ncbi:hypothetical protein PF023_02240 [Enterococcus thailandicus]|nr:hypothetical protein [Enterococcus thailandicus]MDA3972854.1 hypothetical protein [Enterococcus thailandicus]MDA3975712.1 hypothetical protein [Enterococcus thailandicus]MDA3980314.1 hypothetical protein [Enterococcus thailandicus]
MILSQPLFQRNGVSEVILGLVIDADGATTSIHGVPQATPRNNL